MYKMSYGITHQTPLEGPVTRTTDITSFSEHRRNLREHLARVHETGRPLYVTTNGRTDAVVLSPRAYDELAEKAELAESLALLDRSSEDQRTGRVQAMRPALEQLARELGLTLGEGPSTGSR